MTNRKKKNQATATVLSTDWGTHGREILFLPVQVETRDVLHQGDLGGKPGRESGGRVLLSVEPRQVLPEDACAWPAKRGSKERMQILLLTYSYAYRDEYWR